MNCKLNLDPYFEKPIITDNSVAEITVNLNSPAINNNGNEIKRFLIRLDSKGLQIDANCEMKDTSCKKI